MPGVELLFTPKEEVGLVGADAFDVGRLEARARATSTTRRRRSATSSSARRRPRSSALTFVGRAAHAGMYPEEGRSAIVAAARAIADMPLGRLDERDDGQRRRSSAAGRRATSSPSAARSRPRCARTTTRGSRRSSSR